MKTIKCYEATKKYRKTKKGVLTNSYGHQKQRRPVEYTLKQFHDKFMSDQVFNRLFDEWTKSGYSKKLTPTIDRINCKKGYTLDNVRFLTWNENRYKQRMEFKIIRARKVEMIKSGYVVEIFNSVSDAVVKTGLHQGNISSCLSGKRSKCGGHYWKYATEVIGNVHERSEM